MHDDTERQESTGTDGAEIPPTEGSTGKETTPSEGTATPANEQPAESHEAREDVAGSPGE